MYSIKKRLCSVLTIILLLLLTILQPEYLGVHTIDTLPVPKTSLNSNFHTSEGIIDLDSNSEDGYGLYTPNGTFYSWKELKSSLLVDTNNDNIPDSPVLNVSIDGKLSSNYSHSAKTNYSAAILDGTLIISDEVFSIDDYAFSLCEKLVSVVLPETVTSIGKRAFYVCRGLESINLNDNITNIGEFAFYSCTKLTSIYIPTKLSQIANSTFRYCSSATGVITIPDNVTSIGDMAFCSMRKIKYICIPDSVVTIGNNAFSDVPLVYANLDNIQISSSDSWGANELSDITKMVDELNTQEIMAACASSTYDGSRYIKWNDWKDFKSNDLLSGIIDTKYLADKVYLSMKLPSENITYMSYRINPEICYYQMENKSRACGIGAVYQIKDSKLPESFNICIGNYTVYVLYEGENEKWQVFDEHAPLNQKKYFQLRPLPWTDQSKTLAEVRIPDSKTTYHNNYVEFELSNTDLTTDSVLHFYGEKKECISSAVRGMVVIYDIWSDTPNIENRLSATVGIDLYSDNGEITQACWGKNYTISNNVTTVICHSIPDDIYSELVIEGKSPEQCLEMFNNAKQYLEYN